MKKYTIKLVFIGLLAAVLLAGCGSSPDNNNNETPAPEEEPTGETPTSEEQTSGTEQGEPLELVIKAHNFAFDQEKYEVPAGSTVQLSLENTEGHHGLLVKDLNLEVTDGNPVTFLAEPGEYEIVCNIPCGTGHANMKTTLVVK